MSPRVAIGSVMHETNTFSPVPTTLESFAARRGKVMEGQEVIEGFRGARTGLGAFIEIGESEGWDLIGTVAGHAVPSANVDASAHDRLKAMLVEPIRAAVANGTLDGVLLYLHGAMLSENAPDAEGDLCRAVRDIVGPGVPVLVELDLHGNITAEMCAAVDAVFVYDTNPHIDSYERGLETAGCLRDILSGSLPRPQVFISKPPMLPPTINMRTAEGPMRKLLDRGLEWEAGEGIVNVAVFGGFAYADFDAAGAAIVVTATDPELGRRCADDMGRYAWEIRDEFLKRIPTIDEAIAQALELVRGGATKPVVLADVADNPGGGGTGDSTEVLHELRRRGVHAAVACVWDPETVQQAISIGLGNEGDFRIGGKAGPSEYGAPLEVRARVTRLSDGRFIGKGPVIRGLPVDCGPSACIETGDLKLVVTSARHAANDQGYFSMAGIQPNREEILVVKSRGHFRADFEPIAEAIIEVDAPGAANPNLARYAFQHIRRPIWPLDPETTWDGRS